MLIGQTGTAAKYRARLRSVESGRRSGYTLLEILVATTLTLILMYGVAAIFSQIGSLMSQTQNVMGMSNNLRSARNRLLDDLKCLTVPQLKAPSSNYGFFSYVEGLGGCYNKILSNNPPEPLTPQATALNTEAGGADTTVGDTDDILSFTAKAPAGKWFRGRFTKFEKPNETNTATWSEYQQIIESEYAEIVWFVRGTTLYRRVLLIVPDTALQERLADFETWENAQSLSLPKTSEGYGFYRYFDVSVHLDEQGHVVANTLSDLSNRKNRYGYWSSPVLDPKVNRDERASGDVPDGWPNIADEADADRRIEPYNGLHGDSGAWYWLRMPTLQESATVPDDSLTPDEGSSLKIIENPNRYFRAGKPFGFDVSDPTGANDARLPYSRWYGNFTALSSGAGSADVLPSSNPFIDYWNEPNVWSQQDVDSGDLRFALYPNKPTATGNSPAGAAVEQLYTQDVVLTNVISFDVKVWEPSMNRYVDLGQDDTVANSGGLLRVISSNLMDEADLTADASSFARFGRYKYNANNLIGYSSALTTNANLGAVLNYPFMPAVFDTWTEEYEKEHMGKEYSDEAHLNDTNAPVYTNVSRRNGYSISEIPTDGVIPSSSLPDYPPPYDAQMKGIQVEIRVFDPVSRSIRNVTLQVDLSH